MTAEDFLVITQDCVFFGSCAFFFFFKKSLYVLDDNQRLADGSALHDGARHQSCAGGEGLEEQRAVGRPLTRLPLVG